MASSDSSNDEMGSLGSYPAALSLETMRASRLLCPRLSTRSAFAQGSSTLVLQCAVQCPGKCARLRGIHLRSWRSLAFAALAAATSPALAHDADAWGKETFKSLNTCAFVGSAAMIMGTVGPKEIGESRACVDDHIQKAQQGLEALPAQRKGGAAAALKDYYAAWIAGMKAIPSHLVHPRSTASVASSNTKQRLEELWARFEIEAGP